VRKDGSDSTAALACAPLADERGRPAGSSANIEDISDRKRAEEPSGGARPIWPKRSGQPYGQLGMDIATGELTHSSENIPGLLASIPQGDRPSRDEFRQRIIPEDRGGFSTSSTRRPVTEDFEVDCRFVLPDGRMKCIPRCWPSVFSASGDLVQFVGTSMD